LSDSDIRKKLEGKDKTLERKKRKVTQDQAAGLEAERKKRGKIWGADTKLSPWVNPLLKNLERGKARRVDRSFGGRRGKK